MNGAPQLETKALEEASAIEVAREKEELRAQERRSHLALRGRRARRSSVLSIRDFYTEAGRDNAIDLPFPTLISKQPDVGRAVRRAAGIRVVVGLANAPYRRETPKRLSKKARRKGGAL